MAKEGANIGDRVWVGPDVGDGLRPALRVDTEGNLHAGAIGPAGPDADHVLDLRRVKGPIYEVVDEARAVPLSGPPKVASDAYRHGWSRIFGNKPSVGQA